MVSKLVFLVCLAFPSIYGSVLAVSSSANTHDLTDILSSIKGSLTPSTCDPLYLITHGLVHEIEARVAQQIQLEKRVTELENQPTNEIAGKVIAFSARTIVGQAGLTLGMKISFPFIMTNIGDGYNSSTSTFKCPVKGVYQFTVTAVSEYNDFIATQLMVTGRVRMFTYSAGSTRSIGSGSNTVLLELQAGDEVYVRQQTGTKLHSGSTFNGNLVAYLR